MQVTIKLFAHLRAGRFKEQARQYPENTSVGQVLEHLDLSDRKTGIILVNGHPSGPDRRLVDGDTLALLPMVAGG